MGKIPRSEAYSERVFLPEVFPLPNGSRKQRREYEPVQHAFLSPEYQARISAGNMVALVGRMESRLRTLKEALRRGESLEDVARALRAIAEETPECAACVGEEYYFYREAKRQAAKRDAMIGEAS